jgi:lipopolysaccharide heptosyltransferase II
LSIKPLTYKRILLVKTHALGDILMTTPAIRAIKMTFPDSELHFLAGKWSVPAIETNPHINHIHTFDDDIFFKMKCAGIFSLIRTLRSCKYDLAVIFQPSRVVRSVIRLSGIKQVAGFYTGKIPLRMTYPVPWRPIRDRYVGEDFLDIARALGCEDDGLGMEYTIPQITVQGVQGWIQKTLGSDKQYVVICPGGGINPRSTVKQKLWSPERIGNIASNLMRCGIEVVVAGISQEVKHLRSILSVNGIRNLMGKTTISELAALIDQSAFVISNDSFPMHLAIALDRPIIAIFGPSRSEALIPTDNRIIAVTPTVDCAPCYDNEPFPGCKRMDCIESISVNEVWKHVQKALGRWMK